MQRECAHLPEGSVFLGWAQCQREEGGRGGLTPAPTGQALRACSACGRGPRACQRGQAAQSQLGVARTWGVGTASPGPLSERPRKGEDVLGSKHKCCCHHSGPDWIPEAHPLPREALGPRGQTAAFPGPGQPQARVSHGLVGSCLSSVGPVLHPGSDTSWRPLPQTCASMAVPPETKGKGCVCMPVCPPVSGLSVCVCERARSPVPPTFPSAA